MPVISTAFDQDFFDEPLIESDRIESPCKRKCRKNENYFFLNLKTNKIYLRMRYEYLSTCLRFS
jgi:hypothetical protein